MKIMRFSQGRETVCVLSGVGPRRRVGVEVQRLYHEFDLVELYRGRRVPRSYLGQVELHRVGA